MAAIRRLQDAGSAISRVPRRSFSSMLEGMRTTVLRRPLSRAAALLIPALAVLLAAGAIAGSAALVHRAEAQRNHQVQLVQTVNAVDRLQSVAWAALWSGAGTGPVAQYLRGQEELVAAEVARAGLPSVSPRLDANFVTLSAILAYIRTVPRKGGSVAPGTALSLAAAGQRSAGAVTSRLNAAATASARRAHADEAEAVLGSAGAIAVLLAAFGFAYVRTVRGARRQRQAREAAEIAQLELTAALAQLQRAQEDRVRLLARTVEGAEDERRRIAADLHDGPIQRLTATAFSLDLLANRLARGDHDVGSLVHQVRDALAGEMRSLRRLMVELRPPVLDEGGLAAAIRDAAAEILPASTACTVDDRTAAARFTPEVETTVHRIAREALVNVREHAEATRVSIDIERSRDRLEISISDDGVGFDAAEVLSRAPGEHLGLLSIRERLGSVGGELRIVSTAGSGARLEASVPWTTRVPARPAEVRRAVA